MNRKQIQSYNHYYIPLVSIGMAVYNAGNLLRTAIRSIIWQSMMDWELLLIDDGSSDDAIAQNADLTTDTRIRVFADGKNKGLAARLNEAVLMARGKFFARMDQDDIAYPERLEKQVNLLSSDSHLDLTSVLCVAISKDNSPLGLLPYAINHKELCAAPWRGFYLAHPTWMGRTEWFRANPYRVPGPYFCEDQELLLRSYRDSKFATLPEILLAYRVPNRVQWCKKVRTRKTLLNIRWKHFVSHKEYYFALLALMVCIIGICRETIKLAIERRCCAWPWIKNVVRLPEGERKRLEDVIELLN